MNLCDINEVHALLERHGFHFSKAKGQNFLIAEWVPREIAAQSGIDSSTGVLEVGPGIGCLTKELCSRAAAVTAVEVDASLPPILKETLADAENVHIILGDILKQDIPALVAQEFPGLRPAACANLPYYITSPILTALLESRAFSSVTVMVQKEVAERICAAPGSSDYSAFSIFCRYYAKPEILFEVPADCFVPRPKVTSAVIRLSVYKESPWGVTDEKLFFRTVRAAFSVRRKTLLNGLSMNFAAFSRQQLTDILNACGIDPGIRGEALDIPAYVRLSDEIRSRLPHD